MPHCKPRVSFKTLGCRLNQAETATIAAQFEAAGYEVVKFGTPCEVAVIHGCAVTRNAESESIHLAGAARRGKSAPFVILAGCAAVLHEAGSSQAATSSSSCADMLASQDTKFALPGILYSRLSIGNPVPSGTASPTPRFSTVRARVKVQDGCNVNCAYCIVPTTRGPPVSRPFREIVDEVTNLGKTGFKEIILTGANLGCYNDGGRRIVHLLEAIQNVETVERIRLSSIEPATDELALIDFMTQAPKVCRHLHIPLQTGHDPLLAQMGRPYTVSAFRHIIQHAISRLGHIGLGTDIIAGLPGEDDEAFESTYRIVEELPFSNLHVFPYSKRPGTKASLLSGHVTEAARKERVQRLIALGTAKKTAFAEKCIGRKVSILIERVEAPGCGTGWTEEYVKARISSPAIGRNRIVTGIASRAGGGSLYAIAPAQ